MAFAEMTSEQRHEALAKARIAQTARQAARKASTLRRDFFDANLWLELANQRGLRLPYWGEPATVSNMRTWLHKIGWSQAQLEDWAGCKLAVLIAQNLTWPQRALAGVILEEATCTRTTE